MRGALGNGRTLFVTESGSALFPLLWNSSGISVTIQPGDMALMT